VAATTICIIDQVRRACQPAGVARAIDRLTGFPPCLAPSASGMLVIAKLFLRSLGAYKHPENQAHAP
jgi:hypothetical protein